MEALNVQPVRSTEIAAPSVSARKLQTRELKTKAALGSLTWRGPHPLPIWVSRGPIFKKSQISSVGYCKGGPSTHRYDSAAMLGDCSGSFPGACSLAPQRPRFAMGSCVRFVLSTEGILRTSSAGLGVRARTAQFA